MNDINLLQKVSKDRNIVKARKKVVSEQVVKVNETGISLSESSLFELTSLKYQHLFIS